jgi:hypothetical protein
LCPSIWIFLAALAGSFALGAGACFLWTWWLISRPGAGCERKAAGFAPAAREQRIGAGRAGGGDFARAESEAFTGSEIEA